MRALKILVVVMGVMIIAGIIVVVTTIAGRLAGGVRHGGGPVDVTLREPAGAHIAGIAALRDELAVQLQGGGPDRVVLVDPHNGAVIGRVVLERGGSAAGE